MCGELGRNCACFRGVIVVSGDWNGLGRVWVWKVNVLV